MPVELHGVHFAGVFSHRRCDSSAAPCWLRSILSIDSKTVGCLHTQGAKLHTGAVGVHTDMKHPILLLAACVPCGHLHSLAFWRAMPYPAVPLDFECVVLCQRVMMTCPQVQVHLQGNPTDVTRCDPMTISHWGLAFTAFDTSLCMEKTRAHTHTHVHTHIQNVHTAGILQMFDSR